jgi:nucleosome-remodeling factor subunit BPTF
LIWNLPRFYICCDRCGDWFHGTCVGILPQEANNIEEYLCPNCGPKTPLNCANFARLKPSSIADVEVMLKEIMVRLEGWANLIPG